ncbi:methyl-accepting chemotaxis protein [Sphingorhabdus sp. M41]|uniref:methyl-accepting chemotaxis protein n=1 Tax=Sphingorhabdus sp. M41 TaxID=1806885 RepID=UPI002FF815CD
MKIAPIRTKMLVLVLIMTALVAATTVATFFDSAHATGIGIASCIIIFSTGMWLRKLICDPYVTTVVRMEALASGDLDSLIQFSDYEDCVGRMTRAMGTFRDNAVNIQTSSAEREAATTVLAEHLSKLAEGSLDVLIEEPLPGAFAQLSENFNTALTQLQEMIVSVNEGARGIRTGSHEIAQASEDLARRTETNAATLQETSSSLSQIDDRLKATATSANRTVSRADDAISSVKSGRSVADEAVQAMGRVSESAKGIDSVIEGLDKIAFQTRVLAMNAAVEAGRAGEAGRGFAVVADLVSALAMRAEEEAQTARDQLTVTQADIGTAVEAVTKVDSALESINEGVGEVHQLLGQMAADNQVQSTAVTEISGAISLMDQATQQNAAMVEETSAAARNLLTEVDALSENAGKFELASDDRKSLAKKKANQPAANGKSKSKSQTYVPPMHVMANGSGNGLSNGHSGEWADF